MLLIADIDRLDADLAAGMVACRCGGRLRPWGYSTTRRIRLLSAASVQLRPRRARCTDCRATHVLLPAWCLPRRGDAAEVIGAALVARAAGHGHRAIATQLGRPAATVRAWLRGARDDHARWLYRRAVTRTARLDPELLNHCEPTGSMLGDALTALAAAVAAWRRRFSHLLPTWTLVVVIAGGRLLALPKLDQQMHSVGRVCPQ
ncbi:DUF6431 domain-containing protein [Micromonospora globbae]|uniref:DUF6431 domain-containing protein n=1 Tax=Micromonospora globbae TaxID=1894969 RepID=UPI0038643885|nr:DUF6431 domain-containing protein [Micromonospora globbae]